MGLFRRKKPVYYNDDPHPADDMATTPVEFIVKIFFAFLLALVCYALTTQLLFDRPYFLFDNGHFISPALWFPPAPPRGYFAPVWFYTKCCFCLFSSAAVFYLFLDLDISFKDPLLIYYSAKKILFSLGRILKIFGKVIVLSLFGGILLAALF